MVPNLRAKAKGSRPFGKPAKKLRRVSKRVREGTKRWSQKRPFRCQKCGKWFASLKEVNLHYSARTDHKRKTPRRRGAVLKPFHEFSKEKQQKAIEIVNILDNPRKFQMEIQKKMDEYVKRIRFR